MQRTRSHRIATALGAVPLVALAVVLVATASNASQGSTSLHGKFRSIMNFFPPACTSVTQVCSSFNATGDIKGDGVVNVDTYPDANGISKAHTVIHTRKGDLTCSEWAVFDVSPGDHPFVDLCLINGGTGKYDGATGYIQEVGTFDFANNVGQLDYYGKLVYAGGKGSDDDD